MVRRALAASVVVTLLGLPAAAQVTPEDLEAAEARMAEVRAELMELTVRYEAALARDVELEETIIVLEGQVEARALEIITLRRNLEDRVVDMYTGAAEVGLASMFSADEPAEVETRTQYLRDVGVTGRALLNDLEVLTAELDAQLGELELVRLEQQAALADLEQISARLNDRLTAAQSEYQQLSAQFQEEERQRREAARRAAEEAARRAAEEEAARRAAEEEAARQATSTTVAEEAAVPTTTTTAPPEATTTTTTVAAAPEAGAMTCPIDGITSFTDTWGAPRSGGRFHRGVDMLAARGTPVVAVGPGVVLRMRNGGLGGITVWLATDDGDQYYYAHLDAWAPGLARGQRVGTGDLLGTVGTTGNAPAHIPHLHWEYHPGGGGAVNPTPLARSLCG